MSEARISKTDHVKIFLKREKFKVRADDIFLYIWFIGQQNHGSFLSFRGYPLSRNPLFTRNHCKNIGRKKCTSIFLLLLLIGWKAHTFFHFCHKG